ncbi:MAG: hypothetical protein ACE5IM_10040 [Nitrospinota bacterium]
MTKVKIELTNEQKEQVHRETGVRIDSLTYDALEDRDAPKRFSADPKGKAFGIDKKDLDLTSGDEPVVINDPTSE